MKRIIKTTILLSLVAMLCSCAPNGLNVKATEIAKKFYTDYLRHSVTLNLKKMESTKKMYMTEVLCEEIDLRTKEMEADAVTGVQDPTGMIDKMVVTGGRDEDWVKVLFNMKSEEGQEYGIYEIDLHFRDVGKKRMIDTLNMTIHDVDKDGDETKREYMTKFANKESLTDEDKTAMENIKKYYVELAEEGFIG